MNKAETSIKEVKVERLKLSINAFQCYVRDRWKWKEQFHNSVLNYASHSHSL